MWHCSSLEFLTSLAVKSDFLLHIIIITMIYKCAQISIISSYDVQRSSKKNLEVHVVGGPGSVHVAGVGYGWW